MHSGRRLRHQLVRHPREHARTRCFLLIQTCRRRIHRRLLSRPTTDRVKASDWVGRCRSPKRKSVFRSQVANTTYAHYTVLEGSRCLDTARQSVSVSLGRISFVDFVTSTCRTDDDRTPCKPTQDKSSEKSVVLLMLPSLCPLPSCNS